MRASGRSDNQTTMLDKLRAIDTSVVTKLGKVKHEHDRLQGFLKKAAELKDQVNPLVYERVRQDYQSRLASLEQQAGPLKADARREYKKLQTLLTQIEAAFAELGIDKETLEFRHAVGELAKDQVATRLAELEGVLEHRRSELEQVNQVKRAFLHAFPSVEAAVPPPPSTPTPSPDKTVIVPGLLQDIDGTDRPAMSLKTVVPPPARLIKDDEDGPSWEYRLGVLTYIGHTEDNHIYLEGQGVSRKHAQVTASPSGYVLKDLDSQQGTFVNNRRISECVLTSGDRVRIGGVELVFQSP